MPEQGTIGPSKNVLSLFVPEAGSVPPAHLLALDCGFALKPVAGFPPGQS
jgi:hypothetical protein